MNQVKNLKSLVKLSYFTRSTLSQLIDLPDKSLYTDIARWVRNKKIMPLKRGLYVMGEYYDKNARKDDYRLFIANKLREPSYISLEFVLQKYGLLSESVFAITSIALKSKRSYKNELGLFTYKNISSKLFTGFEIRTYGGYEVKEATKMKALFDYLYLKLLRIQKINSDLLLSFRLNLEKLKKSESQEFGRYCNQTKIQKYIDLLAILREAYDI